MSHAKFLVLSKFIPNYNAYVKFKDTIIFTKFEIFFLLYMWRGIILTNFKYIIFFINKWFISFLKILMYKHIMFFNLEEFDISNFFFFLKASLTSDLIIIIIFWWFNNIMEVGDLNLDISIRNTKRRKLEHIVIFYIFSFGY